MKTQIIMNEIRYKVILNMAGNPRTELEEDWQELIQRFKVLRYRVASSGNKDILIEISQQENVLTANKPSKKVYRSVRKKLTELEEIIRGVGGYSR